MAEIKPFRGMRFTDKAGEIQTLTCPPYDIISEDQRQEYLRVNPCNVIRLELPRGENPYEEAGKTLETWLQEGILRQDSQPGFYIYEEEFLTGVTHGPVKKVKGLICLVKAEPFSKGTVLPHEETLSKAKEDRLNLMKATGCNFSQIYSLYMDEEGAAQERIESLSQDTPRYEFSDGLVTHRLWLVNDPVAIQALCEDFAPRKLYIADGHHRYETAVNFSRYCSENGLGDAGYVMMMLVDMENDGLVVFPTHRLVRGLESFDPQALLEGCRVHFTVTEMADTAEIPQKLNALYDEGRKAFAFYCGGQGWHLLELRDFSVMARLLPDKSPASQDLDVTILHSLVLEKLLGIDQENMANQKNLTYTRSEEEALESVRKGESQCAFILNPTRVEEIRDVAAAGEKMPQKSTYFYPKLITGLVMNRMDLQLPHEESSGIS